MSVPTSPKPDESARLIPASGYIDARGGGGDGLARDQFSGREVGMIELPYTAITQAEAAQFRTNYRAAPLDQFVYSFDIESPAVAYNVLYFGAPVIKRNKDARHLFNVLVRLEIVAGYGFILNEDGDAILDEDGDELESEFL